MHSEKEFREASWEGVSRSDAQERKLRGFFQQAPAAIAILEGPDHIYTFANELYQRLFGRSEAQLLGNALKEVFPEIVGQGIYEIFDEVFTTGNPFVANEFPATFREGEVTKRGYYHFTVQPIRNVQGKVDNLMVHAYDVTAMVETRQKFRNVINQSPDLILILKGEDMVLEVANDAVFRLWRVDESALGKPFLEILPEMKDQGFLDLLLEVYHSGKPFKGEEMPAVFEDNDGNRRTIYFDFTYQPFREVDDSISGVLITATDVTNRVMVKRQAEQSNENSKVSSDRFKLVTQATQDVIWDWNLATNEIIWNSSLQAIFGYPNEEQSLHADWWTSQIHPDDRDTTVESVYNTIKKGEHSWSGEYRFRCADGTYKHVFDRGFVQHDERGKPVRMIGSMQDITRQKEYESSLKHSEQKWRELADSIPTFVWTAEADGMLNFLNRYWYEFTGLTEEESLGSGWAQVLHPDDVDRCQIVWNDARIREVFYEVEVRYRSKEGNYRWVVGRGLPIKNEEGKVVAWYGTSSDIHDQKILSENLESIVQERTAELQRSNAELEEFAYAASHDLKEPIRKIHVFSTRLREQLNGVLDEQQNHLFIRMELAAQRMNRLIEDLLAYSHASLTNAEKELIDLNAKVQSVLEDLELEIQEKSATVHVDQLPKVYGHRRQLQQVFQNLISNALKYAKPGMSPEVAIRASKVRLNTETARNSGENDRGYHLIEIADNGIGFEQEDADRIFHVFTRLHGNAEYKGSGVGLSIVKKVINNHGGRIWAESKPGQGSVFKLLLPEK